ncbi:MAG: ribosome recycling factor [Chloroflexi bacterium]|nr:ribosome recycling factor [Chloroflexota bacterium]
MLDDIVKTAEHKMGRAVEVLQDDLGSVRTGRATPALLDRVQVDYYGSPTPVNALATVSAPEPRLIVIQPWDKSMLAGIEKAIQKSDLGINPTNDGQVLRLALPQLTEERRKGLVKQVSQRAEEARVAVRNCRRDAIDHVRKAEKDGGISSEDQHRTQDRLQKLTDQFIKQIDDVARKKETEVMEV